MRIFYKFAINSDIFTLISTFKNILLEKKTTFMITFIYMSKTNPNW